MYFSKSKRLLYLLLISLVLVFGAVPAALADTTQPVLQVGSGSGEIGDQVTIAIELTGVNDIAGGSFDLYYNPSQLTPLSASKGKLLGQALFLPNLNYNDNGRSAVRIVWAAATGVSRDGVVCQVDFKLLSSGNAELRVGNLLLHNEAAQEVAAGQVPGSISIAGDTGNGSGGANSGSSFPSSSSNSGSSSSGNGNSPSSSASSGNSTSVQTGQAGVDSTTSSNQARSLKDVQGHWAQNYIEQLVEREIINGYSDGTFQPEQYISRAEFAKVIALAVGLAIEEDADLNFADSNNIAPWARPYIAAAVKTGIIQGYNDGTFRAQNNISRAEIAVMVARALQEPLLGEEELQVQEPLPDRGELQFADASEVPDWAQAYVSMAVKAGIINGTPDNTFLPSQKANRAQAAAMIVRLMNK